MDPSYLISRFGALSAATVLAAGCGDAPSSRSGSSGGGDPIVATAGDRVIRASEAAAEIRRRVERGESIPSRESLIEDMIQREAALARAATGGTADDPEVKRQIDNLLIAQLRERELEPALRSIAVNDDETRAAYDARIDEFTQPASARLAILFLALDPKMSESKQEEIRRRIEEARARALSEPPVRARGAAAGGFGTISVDFSDDQLTRHRGGDIGWLEEGRFDYRWPREVLEAGYALGKGEISDVIPCEDGLYVVKKSDARAVEVRPFEDVRGALRQSLLAEKRRAAEEAFLRDIRDGIKTSVNAEALARIPIPSPASLAADDGAPPMLPAIETPAPPSD